MKKYIALFGFFISCFMVSAQTVEQIKADEATWLWGEGSGNTLEEADNQALSFLTGQISTRVESYFELVKQEVTENQETTFSEKVESLVRTYSTTTLQNTHRIMLSDEPEARVFRFVKRSEVEKIFSQRSEKINEYVALARQAEDELRIADALRLYYWSYALLRSLPQGDNMSFTFPSGKERLLAVALPEKIRELLEGVSMNVQISAQSQKRKQLMLQVLYHAQPVTNFEFTYWNGTDWSPLHEAKNGKALVTLWHTATGLEALRVKAEYLFEQEALADPDVASVLKLLATVPFRQSHFLLSMEANGQESLKTDSRPLLTSIEEPEYYKEVVAQVVQAIEKEHYTAVRRYFTDAGYGHFTRLVAYGRASVLPADEPQFVGFRDGVIARSVPMQFQFQNNHKVFVEEVVFYFNASKKVEALSFGLSKPTLKSILENSSWSQNSKIQLVTFLEHYKTAYALKRLAYLRTLFHDEALIITGYTLKPTATNENLYGGSEVVRYNRQSKQEYMRNLGYTFARKEYINIRFDETNLRKAGKGGEIYGVQIKQHYYSSNYADSGYLFLLVDMNAPEKPVIHVRTWQPSKDTKGHIYGISDFN